MVRRSLRAGLWLGLFLGLAWSMRRMLLHRRAAGSVEVSRDPWTPLPHAPAEPTGPPTHTAAVAPPVGPTPAKATKATKAARAAAPTQSRTWAAPQDGACPPGHPVKAKTSSRIFRVPGMSGYDGTRPDRCYRSEDDAVADGFTRAKR